MPPIILLHLEGRSESKISDCHNGVTWQIQDLRPAASQAPSLSPAEAGISTTLPSPGRGTRRRPPPDLGPGPGEAGRTDIGRDRGARCATSARRAVWPGA